VPREIREEGVTFHRPDRPAGPPSTSSAELATHVAKAAADLGFARVGFTPADPLPTDAARLREWLGHGYQGSMGYLQAGPRDDPRALLAEARTLIVVALSYALPARVRRSKNGDALVGQVAGYAQGGDYHLILKRKLCQLGDRVAELVGRPVLARACVDTAPLLERAAAARAGVGFVAKSTLVLVPGLGTSVLLGELLCDVEIAPSAPVAPGCGTCTACLEACPTGAFVAPHVLDARRCISYLTIEHSGTIPRELRAAIGTRVFGCDVCQDVCPHNASQQPRSETPELAPDPARQELDLVSLLELRSGPHKKLVRRSALRRTHRYVFARNAAVALGNSGDPCAVTPLVRALEKNESALVRAHVAWALGRLGGEDARNALEAALDREREADVIEELRAALAELPRPT
jgi:epoxyqueuosine reductase